MSKISVFSVKEEEGAYTVYRDDAALQTPRNLNVTVPTKKLAEAIVSECAAQKEKLDLRQMPFTQMSLTAIDIAAQHRADVIKGIMKLGETDLLCQRAADPAELVAKQNEIWQPYLDWARSDLGAELTTGTGIVPVTQSDDAMQKLREPVEALDAFGLVGLSEAASILGSLVLGLALAKKHATADQAFTAAELDHIWQSGKWGEDPETQQRQAEIKAEVDMCARYFSYLEK